MVKVVTTTIEIKIVAITVIVPVLLHQIASMTISIGNNTLNNNNYEKSLPVGAMRVVSRVSVLYAL